MSGVSVVGENLVQVSSLIINQHGDDAADVVSVTSATIDEGVALHADLLWLMTCRTDHWRANLEHLQKMIN